MRRDAGHRVGEGDDRRAGARQAGAERPGLARGRDHDRQLRVDAPRGTARGAGRPSAARAGRTGRSPARRRRRRPRQVGDRVGQRDVSRAAPRACRAVDSRSSGMNRTARRSRGASNRSASTPSGVAADTTNPPSRRPPRCPGDPRSRSRAGAGPAAASGSPASALPATSPPTVAAADDPRPRASGISLRIADPPADALRAARRGSARSAASRPRTKRFSRSSVSSLRPSPSTVSSISPRLQPRTSTSIRLVSASATPRQS